MSTSREGPDATGELELKVVERTGPQDRMSNGRAGVLEQSGSVILDGLEEEDEDASITAAIDPAELPADIYDDTGSGLMDAFDEGADLSEVTSLADPLPDALVGDAAPTPVAGSAFSGLVPPPSTAPSSPLVEDADSTAAVEPLDFPEPEPAPPVAAPARPMAAPEPLVAAPEPEPQRSRSPLSSLLSGDDEDDEEPTLARMSPLAPTPVPSALLDSVLDLSAPAELKISSPPPLPVSSPEEDEADSLVLPSPAEKMPALAAPPAALRAPMTTDEPGPPSSPPATRPPMPALVPAPTPTPAAPASPEPAGPRVVYADGEDGDSMDGEVTSIYESLPATQLPRGRLMIVSGEDSGKVYYLNRPKVGMGRGTDNDVVLLDIAVSRHHARIERHHEGFTLVDQDSGNGTLVNGARIRESELYDGDRVELGNILLEFTTLGGTRRRPEPVKPAQDIPQQQTDPGRAIASIKRPRSRWKSAPPVWLVFVATFVVITALTLLVQRSLMSNREAPEDPARVKARMYYDRAESAMRSRDWGQAQADLATAAELAPELYRNGELRTIFEALNAQIEQEQIYKLQLDEATALVQKATPEAIKGLVAAIPQDSVYHPDAMRLVEKTRQIKLDNRTKEAERLAQAGFVAQALVITEEVLAQAPNHGAARKLGGMLKAAVREGTPPAELVKSMGRASPADQRARRDLADALRLYRDGQFPGALAALERGEARRPSRALKRRLDQRSEKIKAFSEAWRGAEQAMRGRRADDAITGLSQASALDQELGGFFAHRIHEKLAVLHYIKAKEAYDAGRWPEARRNTDRVLSLAPADPNGRKLRERLNQKARELLHQGQNSSLKDPRGAQRLVRQVLTMASEDSETYQKAYRLLQQLNP